MQVKFSVPIVKAINRVHQQASSGQVFTKPEMFKMCSTNTTDWSKALWGCFIPFTDGSKYNVTKYRLDPAKFDLVLAQLQIHLKSLEQ